VWATYYQTRKRPFTLGPLEMSVRLFPADFRTRDIDNVLKPLLDALEHAQVFANDSQIARLTVERLIPDPKNPRCEVSIGVLPPASSG
jgi:Holliday junction resolvase RusA-like endonuclease